jgi:transcriptional regulator with XRE-family HTH domain
MKQFNKIEFGNKLRFARLKKEVSLEYVGRKIGKSSTTVGRYERGEVIPNAKVLSKLCEILDIYDGDLYRDEKSNIINIDNSKNPFKTNKLYLYYQGFVGKKKLGKFKFIIELKEKNDFIEVRISDYKTKKTILIGSMVADNYIATIRTENFKANYPRLETNQIILNISGGTEDIVIGMMMCTNGEYIPNIKKCLVSKKDLIFTDEMLDMLLLTEEEKEGILKNNIWQADISRIEEFEYKED